MDNRTHRSGAPWRNFYGRLKGLNYAQARYLCLYMQRQGVLRRFYAHFREHHGGDGADVKAIEHVFGRSIEEVEKDYLAWVMTLRWR